jgi:uncharacterized membrane protein (UPF0127 family)
MLSLLLRLIAKRYPSKHARVEIATSGGPVHLDLEVADSLWRRALGMMGRTDINANGGMIFIYPHPRIVRLWMANTPLSLDAIFVDETSRILKIAHRLQPNSRRWVSSDTQVKWVLEIPGGQAIALGISTGDLVSLPI